MTDSVAGSGRRSCSGCPGRSARTSILRSRAVQSPCQSWSISISGFGRAAERLPLYRNRHTVTAYLNLGKLVSVSCETMQTPQGPDYLAVAAEPVGGVVVRPGKARLFVGTFALAPPTFWLASGSTRHAVTLYAPIDSGAVTASYWRLRRSDSPARWAVSPLDSPGRRHAECGASRSVRRGEDDVAMRLRTCKPLLQGPWMVRFLAARRRPSSSMATHGRQALGVGNIEKSDSGSIPSSRALCAIGRSRSSATESRPVNSLG